MTVQTITMNGKEYVIVEKREYQRLATLAKAADLPPLPKPDRQGNYPALEYARTSLARKIIAGRVDAGLTQKELAQMAGIRIETLCRIETGKTTPSALTAARIDKALRKARKEN